MSAEIEATDLEHRAHESRGWRWYPGMLLSYRYGGFEDTGKRYLYRLDGDEDLSKEAIRFLSSWLGDGTRVWGELPVLSDPATLGCMLDMVRQIHGRSTVIRLVGTDGQGGEEWAICDRAPGGMAAPAIYGFASELEALVAALEAAP